MPAKTTLAIVPKARGMYAGHLTQAEYEELMRRRTVPEVAATLKRHPYYQDSLATLSITDPHRGQIEELLNMDVFLKYAALIRYDYSGDAFFGYYLGECEMREVLQALHLISIGLPGAYRNQVPPYLVGKTKVDLFALGQARSFADVVELTRPAGYNKALRQRYLADPTLRDFPLAEAAIVRYSYTSVFSLIRQNLQGPEQKSVLNLFLQDAENYNLQTIARIKTYYANLYRPDDIRRLIIPRAYYHVHREALDSMIEARDTETLLTLYRQVAPGQTNYAASLEDLAVANGRAMYGAARRLLHLTTSPAAALAAFVTLAKLERENVVNIIEGVRYGLAPETMRAMLRY